MPRKLSTAEQDRPFLAAGLVPTGPYRTQASKRECQCQTCGAHVSFSWAYLSKHRAPNKGRGCKACYNKTARRPPDYDSAFEEAGFECLEPYHGSDKPRRCRCTTCRRVSTPRYADLKHKGTGCKHCKYVKPTEVHERLMALDLEATGEDFRTSSEIPVRCLRCNAHFPCNISKAESRTSTPCPSCARRNLLTIFHDFRLSPHPEHQDLESAVTCRCLLCGELTAVKRSTLVTGRSNGRGVGCETCLGHKIRASDLDRPWLAQGLRPLEPWRGSHHKRLTECTRCGETYRVTSVQLRSTSCKGCKYCTGRKTRPGQRDAVFESVGLQPIAPYVSSTKPRECRCRRCNSIVATRHADIRLGKTRGCKFCLKAAVRDPDCVFISKGLAPMEPYKGTNTPRLCKCTACGEEVRARRSVLARNLSRGCPFCSGKKVRPSDIDRPFEALRLRPLEPYVRTSTPRQCECLECGRQVKVSRNNAMHNHGCKYCAAEHRAPYFGESSFLDDPELAEADGFIYLFLFSNAQQAFQKIGIGKKVRRNKTQYARLREHETKGGQLMQLRELKLYEAWVLERQIKRDFGGYGFVPSKESVSGGATESFTLEAKIDLFDYAIVDA